MKAGKAATAKRRTVEELEKTTGIEVHLLQESRGMDAQALRHMAATFRTYTSLLESAAMLAEGKFPPDAHN